MILAAIILHGMFGDEAIVIPFLIVYGILFLLWKAAEMSGTLSVRLVRDLPLLFLRSERWDSRTVRLALVFWLVLFPVLAFVLMILRVHHLTGWIGTLVLLPFLARVIFSYYHEILKGLIKQRRWPRFVMEYYLILAEARMDWIYQSTQARFWLIQKIKR